MTPKRTYTIKEGKHRASGIWMPRLHFKRTQVIRHEVTFYQNCSYELDFPDQMDINKLFGVSNGYHHHNSARFGWRWELGRGMVEILAYVYVDGKRITESMEDIHICYVHPWMKYKYTLIVEDDRYVFSLLSSRDNKKTKTIKHDGLTWWGYYLNPYFGGNQTAPHEMSISFD